MEQQIAEIAGVQRLQPVLIERIHALPAAIGVAFIIPGIEHVGSQPLVLPAVDQPAQLARGPAFFVQFLGLNELLQKAQLIVGIENGEIALQPDQLGMPLGTVKSRLRLAFDKLRRVLDSDTL